MTWFRAVVVMVLCVAASSAADWPQWLGPKRDGSTSEKVAAWKDKDDLKVVWKQSVGNGYASPVVAGGRVFIHAAVKDRQEEQVVAFDAGTGKELWKDVYERPAYRSVLGVGPRATPTVANKRLYTMGINGVLSAYEVESGKRRWQVDLYKQFKADLPNFAVCCSPLVIGNRVIVSIGGKGRCAVALHAETGEVQWQAMDDAASTSSPVLFASGNRTKGAAPDVVLMTPLRLVGLDPLDGTLRWEHPMVFQPSGTSPTPIAVGKQVIASTQAHGAVAIAVSNKDEKIVPEMAWQNKEQKSYFSSGVASGSLLFLITNTVQPLPSASMTCLEAATGKQLWRKTGVGYFHAGVLRTGDGKLLILNDSGLLTLLEIDAKGAKELARAKVCAGTLVTPALADGKLYTRDGKELICTQLPK